MSKYDFGGTYMIKNMVTNEYYVGSTENIRKRFNQHRCNLLNNRHHCENLQNAFNFYGKDNFDFIVIEKCSIFDLLENKEQILLDNGFANKCIYNTLKQAYRPCGENHPMYGKTHTLEAKNKIKEARKRQVISHSLETRNKISLSNTGKSIDEFAILKMKETKRKKFSNGDIVPWNKGKSKLDFPSLNSQTKIKFSESDKIKILELYLQDGYSINYLSKKFAVSWDRH